jgi:hypothetical protein
MGNGDGRSPGLDCRRRNCHEACNLLVAWVKQRGGDEPCSDCLLDQDGDTRRCVFMCHPVVRRLRDEMRADIARGTYETAERDCEPARWLDRGRGWMRARGTVVRHCERLLRFGFQQRECGARFLASASSDTWTCPDCRWRAALDSMSSREQDWWLDLVERQGLSPSEALDLLAKDTERQAHNEQRRLERAARLRMCPDCGVEPLSARRRKCDKCKAAARKATKSRSGKRLRGKKGNGGADS